MRLYIWEGKGISSAYHDDGTLVVLAETVEQAREVAIRRREADRRADRAHQRRMNEYWDAVRADDRPPGPVPMWRESDPLAFDGDLRAIRREPDRVVELDTVCVVAFNGGGYD